MEIIVMVAMIGILTTVVIANYNGSQQRQGVIYTAHQVEQDLRKIQALSLAGKRDDSNSATERPCSFGIQLKNDDASENFYLMFRELPTCNKKYSSAETGDATIEGGKIYLSSGVIIGRITRFDVDGNILVDSNGEGADTTTIDITYGVPFADLSFDNDSAYSVKIEIKNKSGFSKIISIKSTGEISID